MTLAVIDSARFSGPLIDAAFSQSTGTAVVAALATYAGVAVPVAFLALTALKGRLLRATGISVILYVIARAAMQLFGDSLYPAALGVTTIAVASWVLCLATVRYAFSSRKTVSALLGGAALAVTSQLLLGTWDLAWRSDLLALILITFGLMGLFLLGSFAITKQAAGPDINPTRVRVNQLWPMGLWLSLTLMVFANPAFLASQSGYALGWSGAFLIGAAAVGISLLSPEEAAHTGPSIAPVNSGWQRTVASLIGFAGGITGALTLSGITAFIAALVALLCSIPLLLDVLASREATPLETPIDLEAQPPRPGVGVLTVSGLLVGLLTVLPVLLFQLDYDIPLPVPNFLVLTGAALAIGLMALWAVWRHPASPLPGTDEAAQQVTAVSIEKLGGGALLLVALFAGIMAPSIPSSSATAVESDDLRVMSWNLHYGVSDQPRVALDEISTAIATESPDVVLLQEVSRGWILGGGADMLTWLASGLDMEAAWAPAADRQFGNVVLSKWPVSDVSAYRLPYGDGPQNRSFVSATIAHPTSDVRVTSTHLQHRADNADTRLSQVSALLERVTADDNGGLAILAGDFNAIPDSDEIAPVLDAGWVSAIDAAGDATQNTHPSHAPEVRIDWLFSGPGLQALDARVLTQHTPSDHLPLVADFTLGTP